MDYGLFVKSKIDPTDVAYRFYGFEIYRPLTINALASSYCFASLIRHDLHKTLAGANKNKHAKQKCPNNVIRVIFLVPEQDIKKIEKRFTKQNRKKSIYTEGMLVVVIEKACACPS